MQDLFRSCWGSLERKVFTARVSSCSRHRVRRGVQLKKFIVVFIIWLWMLTWYVVVFFILRKQMFKLDFDIENFRPLTWLWFFYTWCILSQILRFVGEFIVHILRSAVRAMVLAIIFAFDFCRIRRIWWIIFTLLRVYLELKLFESLGLSE